MNFSSFLSDWPDDNPNRTAWFERFQKAEPLAKQCVGEWRYVNLQAVVLTDKHTCWEPTGTVRVTDTSLSGGALYHELFHSVLHNSPFTKKAQANKPNYELYCEGLCQAFEYFMEQMGGPEGNVTKKIKEWHGMSWMDIIKRSSDLS